MASVGWGKGDESMRAQAAVLVAERELAAAEGEPSAEVIDLGVTWDGGAPMPQVISDGVHHLCSSVTRASLPPTPGAREPRLQ